MSSADAYPTESESTLLAAADQLMRAKMAGNDPSHDALHVLRVRNTALKLARAQPAGTVDLLVVELAALLHDILDRKYTPAGTVDPRVYFADFFGAHREVLSEDRAELVLKVVDHVSWTTEKKLRASNGWGKWHDECVELHCVQDADRLDAIGAIGVMRCAAYSARVSRPLHVPPGNTQDACQNPNEDDSAIAHFHDKLVLIRDRLKTKEGREMGEQRHQYMLEFLKQIDIECL